MKRELLSVLIGAALIVPADVEAQRGRKHVPQRGPRVVQTPTAVSSGRLARCRAPAHARSFDCRPANRVVYSSRAGYRPATVYRPDRDARIRVRLDWGRSRLHFRTRPHMARAVGPAQLRRILGTQNVNRIRRAGRRLGLRGPLRGHWVESWRHGLALVVTMDRVDVAEFVDYDRDGFIDDAFFFRHDGRRWVSRP